MINKGLFWIFLIKDQGWQATFVAVTVQPAVETRIKQAPAALAAQVAAMRQSAGGRRVTT
jgi:hypothetical protein